MPDENDKSDWITEGREVARQLVDAIHRGRKWLDHGAATNMLASIAATGDPAFSTGAHQGLTKDQITNLTSSVDAFSLLYDTHRTNLQNVAHGG